MRPEEDKVAYTKKKIRAQMEKNQGVGGGEIRLGGSSRRGAVVNESD